MKAKTRFFYFVIFIFFIQTILFSVANAATRIMPLGDSITQGSASGETEENRQVSYRKALWDDLIAAGYDVDFVGSLNSGETLFDDGDHEGHPGWTDDEIVNGNGVPAEGKLDEWLAAHQPDVVLLHIGTNGLDPSPDDVEDILVEIDTYDLDTWVILALIINRLDHECPDSSDTTTFNENVLTMANLRIAAGDKIVIVDMECGAGINYLHKDSGGDMENLLHPYQYGTGYDKMADVWFDALEQILPAADFTADPTSAPIPLTVSFTDESTGEITDFTWDFGDGSGSSTQQNPSYTYNDPGTYTVSLTATGPAGTDTETKTDYITVINSNDGGGGGGCFISTATHGL